MLSVVLLCAVLCVEFEYYFLCWVLGDMLGVLYIVRCALYVFLSRVFCVRLCLVLCVLLSVMCVIVTYFGGGQKIDAPVHPSVLSI